MNQRMPCTGPVPRIACRNRVGVVGALVTITALTGCASAPAWRFDSTRERALAGAMQAAVTAGDVTGLTVLVTSRDSILFHRTAGRLAPGSAATVGTDAVFNIASMTKPVTALAAMMLVEDGRLALDAPASTYLPELVGRGVLLRVDSARRTVITRPASREITVRDLMRHTSGIGYAFSNPALHDVERFTSIPERDWPLVHDPGARWTYGMGPSYLGWIVERIAGMPLESFFRQRIFTPLGMHETSYVLPPSRASRLMALSDRRGDSLVARPRPDSVQAEGFGDGNLFSTAPDYARFMQLLLGRGTWRGTRLVREASIRELMRDQLGALTVLRQPTTDPALSAPFPDGATRDGFSLAFQVARGHPDGRPDGSLSWAGLYNTHLWIDPPNGIGVLVLTQVLPFHDPRVMDVVRAVEHALYLPLAAH
ncbi:MAG: beta-lactamase family protein [Gemmatimonadaceae bacterium]|nr:beta-lactamase family protein [Gemmatimonadaceae bacterium]